jgi:hypothetical protein
VNALTRPYDTAWNPPRYAQLVVVIITGATTWSPAERSRNDRYPGEHVRPHATITPHAKRTEGKGPSSVINKIRGKVRGHAVQAEIINGDVRIHSHWLIVAVVSALLGAVLTLAIVYFGLGSSRLNASRGHGAPTAGPTTTALVRQTPALEPPQMTTRQLSSDSPKPGPATPPGTAPTVSTTPPTTNIAPPVVTVSILPPTQSATPSPSRGTIWWEA